MRSTLLVLGCCVLIGVVLGNPSNYYDEDEFVGISGREYDDIRRVVGDSYAFSSRGLISSGASSIKKVFSAIKNFRPSKFLFRNNTEAYGHPLCIVRQGENDYHHHLKRLRRDVSAMPLVDQLYNEYGAYDTSSSGQRDFSNKNKVVCVLMFDHPEDSQCLDLDNRDWHHMKQHLWPKDDNECSGFAQSPVNLIVNKNRYTNALKVKCTYNVVNSTVSNNGYTLDIAPNGGPAGVCTSPDGRDIYEFQGAHFHWGPTDKSGSEHYINGKPYPLELHMVHKNSRYSSVAQAQQYPDGLMVLGYFFSVNSQNSMNEQYWDLIKNLPRITGFNDSVQMQIDFAMMGSLKRRHFFTYQGSLTTPPCSEAVTWVVYTEPIPITSYALQQIRRLQDSCGRPISANFRYLQRMNGRSLVLNRA
ncbi:CA14.2 family protein [Megaselia abdita]